MDSKFNCIIVDDEPIAREILESFIKKVPQFNLLKTCGNAMEAFNIISNQEVDLIFLDINMPEVSGLSLAKSINKKIKIIFTTAYREYALDGFDLHALDYLLKPISFERFLQSVNKLFETTKLKTTSLLEKKPTNDYIFVRADRKMVKISFNEIIYIESLSDYIKIHTKEKIITTRETISNIETKLPSFNFIRSHRSYIISISKITSFTNEYIEINKKAIPISRSYKESVLQKLVEM